MEAGNVPSARKRRAQRFHSDGRGIMTPSSRLRHAVTAMFVLCGLTSTLDAVEAEILYRAIAVPAPEGSSQVGAAVPEGIAVASEAKELLTGRWLDYRLQSHPKARGLDATLMYPASWKPEEADGPYIVQKFTGRPAGGSCPYCMVLVIPGQPAWAKRFLKGKIAGPALLECLKEMIPDNAHLVDGGRAPIDGRPGAWFTFSHEVERDGARWSMHSLAYSLFHRGNTLFIGCDVAAMAGDEEALEHAFASYLPVFQAIGNSVVLGDERRGDISPAGGIGSAMTSGGLANIVLSAVLFWAAGLLPSVLIRFLFLRAPVARPAAVALAAAFLLANIALCATLGRAGGTYGAVVLVAFVSYVILSRGRASACP